MQPFLQWRQGVSCSLLAASAVLMAYLGLQLAQLLLQSLVVPLDALSLFDGRRQLCAQLLGLAFGLLTRTLRAHLDPSSAMRSHLH